SFFSSRRRHTRLVSDWSSDVCSSDLLSWANMLGWFRSYSHDFSGALNEGNHNHFVSKAMGAAGVMKGIVFDRDRAGTAQNDWDGQFMIAALEAQGVEV